MTPGGLIISIGALLLLLLFSALVSAVETALFSLREHHLRSIRVRFGARLKLLDQVQSDPRKFLDGAVFLGAIANLALAVLAFFLLKQLSRDWGFDILAGAWILFGSLFLLGDIVPKFLALAQPGHVLSWTLGPFYRMASMTAPVSLAFSNATDRLVTLLAPSKIREPSRQFEDEELGTLLEMREEKGTLVRTESEMIQEVFRLGSKNAKDCMTPRVKVVCLESGTPDLQVDALIASTEHWNLPVYKDTPDSIIGVLDVRAYLLNRSQSYERFIRSPVFVPETMKALDLFKKYLREPKSLVLVLDEYGGFEGIVTHTDFVEEIMGDAAPSGNADRDIVELPGSRLRVKGAARLDEIEALLGLRFREADGLDTIGGLIFTQLGYVPARNEEFDLAEVHVRVVRATATRVEELILALRGAAPPRHRSAADSPAAERSPGFGRPSGGADLGERRDQQ